MGDRKSEGRRPKAELRGQKAGGGGSLGAVSVRWGRARAVGNGVRWSPTAQGRQGRHDALAEWGHRADAVQGENASQATKQDQEIVKVRTYTVPAGSRVEQSQMWEGERPREPKLLGTAAEIRARGDARPPGPQLSIINSQPSPTFLLSAPMPVIEREETRARTELGAAQKDTARELGAKLSSLKGIVWVGVGLFVFGLGSLVYPPLKVIVGSVTTSAALILGGVALMVRPA